MRVATQPSRTLTANDRPRLGPRPPDVVGVEVDEGRRFSALLLLFATFLIPEVVSIYLGPVRLPLMRLGILLLMIPALVLFFSRKGGRLYAFDWFYIAFVLWTVLCTLINRGAGGVEMAGVFLLEYLILYFIVQAMVNTIGVLRAAIMTLLGIVAILGVFGVLEAVTQHRVLFDYGSRLMGLGPTQVNWQGVDDNRFRLGLLRARTSFGHAILHGMFCAAMLSFAWYTIKNATARLFWCGVVVASSLTALSAGPLIAVVVQMIAIGIEMVTRSLKNRFRLIMIGTAGFMLLVQLVAESGVYRLVQIFTLNPGSAYYRTLIWRYGVDNVMAHPIFGMRAEEWVRLSWMVPSVDNYWLVQAMNGGIPSVVFLLTTLILITRRMFERPDAEIPSGLVGMRRAWAFSTLGLAVCASTVHLFDKMQPFWAIMIGFGAAICRLLVDHADARKTMAAPDGPSGDAPRRRTVM